MKTLTRAILMAAIVAAMGVGAFAGTASAGTFVHKQTSMKVSFPASWKVEAPGGSLAGARTPDGKVAVVFRTVRAGSVGAATQQLEEQLGRLVRGVTLSRQQSNVNGMAATFFNGVGKAGSQDAQVGAVLVATKQAGVWLMSFAMGKKADYGRTSGDVNGIYRSIAPAG